MLLLMKFLTGGSRSASERSGRHVLPSQKEDGGHVLSSLEGGGGHVLSSRKPSDRDVETPGAGDRIPCPLCNGKLLVRYLFHTTLTEGFKCYAVNILWTGIYYIDTRCTCVCVRVYMT